MLINFLQLKFFFFEPWVHAKTGMANRLEQVRELNESIEDQNDFQNQETRKQSSL